MISLGVGLLLIIARAEDNFAIFNLLKSTIENACMSYFVFFFRTEIQRRIRI